MTLKEDAIAIFRQRGQVGTLGEFVDAVVEAADRRMAVIDEREARNEREAVRFAELMRDHEEVMRHLGLALVEIRELKASQGA